jgi:hypothetical protein
MSWYPIVYLAVSGGADNISWRQRGQAPFVQSTLRAAPRQTEPVPFAKKTCRTLSGTLGSAHISASCRVQTGML